MLLLSQTPGSITFLFIFFFSFQISTFPARCLHPTQMVEYDNRSKPTSMATSAYAHVDGSSPSRIQTSFMVTPPLAPLVVGWETAEHSSTKNYSNSSKQQKSLFSFSLFSRFSGRNRSLSNIIARPEPSTKQVETRKSLPNSPVTPSIKHSLSVPIFISPSKRTSDQSSPSSPSSPSQKYWEPIPLNEAFTQAIRIASLPASSLSMETIIRRNSERDRNPRDRRSRILSRSHTSTKSVDLDWTRKTFVLIEGFLLQYGRDGLHNRSPEKTLQLTSSSIAFASDVIPGRPWVLQVYRTSVDGSLLPERKGSFLSKIAFKGPAKYTAASLLLVFDGAEEMDAWMGCIRSEAMRLAGGTVTKLANGSGLVGNIQEEAEDEEQDDPRHSRRFIIDREANSFIRESSSEESTSKRASTYFRHSTEAGRSFTTTISGDRVLLDQPRGSRVSINSASGTKASTVSPDTSPDRESVRNKRSSAAPSARSRSSVELRPPPQRPISAIDRDGNIYLMPRTPSPSAPNFSLPISLSSGYAQQGNRRATFSATTVEAPPPLPTKPLATQPSLSALSTIGTLPDTPYPRQRSRQSQSYPASPAASTSPTARSPPATTRRRRPVSMFDAQSSPPEPQDPSNSTPSIRRQQLQAGIAIPPRTKSLRRKSMTALGPSGGLTGPLLHPPPSIPLPQLPPAGNYMNGDVMYPSFSSSYYRRFPPPPTTPTKNPRPVLGNRHSFHGVRRERYI